MTENYQTSPTRRKERVEKTFLDVTFLKDPKIIHIKDRFGLGAVTLYLSVALPILSEGGQIHKDIAVTLIKTEGVDAETATQFLGLCLEIELFYQEGKFIRSHRADKEIDRLGQKRDTWRENQRRYRDKTETQNLSDMTSEGQESDSEKEHVYVQDLEKEKEQEPDLKKYLDHVYLDPIRVDQWRATQGDEVVKRAIYILNGDIEQARGDPNTFPKKLRIGRTGAHGAMQKWVLTAARAEIEKEKPKTFVKTGPEPPSRPKLQDFVPPKDIPVDAEQAAKNKKLLTDLSKSIGAKLPT